MMTAATCALLFALCVCACVQGRITHRHVRLDPRDHFELERPFGFDKTGHVEVRVTNLAAYGREPDMEVDLSQFGLFLASPSMRTQLETLQTPEKCYLKQPTLIQLLDFGAWNTSTTRLDGKFEAAGRKDFVPGEYTLYYADCNRKVGVTFDVRVVMYNVGPTGEPDYLSVGERPLPTIYMFMFLAFSVLAVLWAKVCYDERRHVHGIHYLMFALVVLRAVVYFTSAGMYYEDRFTGSPDGWNVAFYVFTFLRGVMFFVVIILIGTGWSYLRPFIGENEKKVLVVVIPLQIFANIAIIILEETSPARKNFVNLTDLFHLVDIICCCAILFPIVWSIKHLREGAESDGKAAVNVEKLTLFRQFYVLVVVYIYFTRIIVYLLDNTLPYNYKWAGNLASELATLAFYVTVGMKFRPHGENAYLKLDSDAAL